MEVSTRGANVDAALDCPGADKRLSRSIGPDDIPSHLHIGVGGGVNNSVCVSSLRADGRFDLASEAVDILTGMGEGYWREKRPVTLLYTTGGAALTIRVNDKQLLMSTGCPAWADGAYTLNRFGVELAYDDTLELELDNMNDESAIWLVGVDAESNRVLFATHPLTWRAGADHATTPRIVSSDQSAPIANFRDDLHIDFPGFGITCPDEAATACALRTTIK